MEGIATSAAPVESQRWLGTINAAYELGGPHPEIARPEASPEQ